MDRVDALKTALSVLAAICDRHLPDEAEVAKLRTAAPNLADRAVDELAREVIQRSIRGKSVNSEDGTRRGCSLRRRA
jgi:hypothetical protein